MKLCLDEFVVEVTRRCNIECAHCLRGEPQDLDIDMDMLRRFLANVSTITEITFTGGEPALNLKAIRATLEICEELGIDVAGFFIATNGTVNVPDLMRVVLDWYIYCGCSDTCHIALSSGDIHGNAGGFYTSEAHPLTALAFFYEKEDADYGRGMLSEGRMSGWSVGRTLSPDDDALEIYQDDATGDVTVAGQVYITVDGKILSECNVSYERMSEFTICPADEFLEYCERKQEEGLEEAVA